MKDVGIVRRADKLGRVVLPKEMRMIMGIKQNDLLEFFVDGKTIVLKKYSHGCFICGAKENVQHIKGIYIYAPSAMTNSLSA